MKQVRIEVLKYSDDGEDEIVKTLGPMPIVKADKTERGLNINLNHADYWTRQVETMPDNVSGMPQKGRP